MGDYQRQLFLMDHAGLPLKTVLEQLDILGEEVVPVLRREFAALKPAHVPDAPTHAAMVAATLDHDERKRDVGMTSTIAVVSAGLSQPSSTRLLADQLAAATDRALRLDLEHGPPRRGAHEVIELRDLAHAITDNLLTGFPLRALADAVQTLRVADAVIAVTPVFGASYSGLFKSFFDVLEEGTLDGKPVLLAATAGTARHSLVLEFAMRPLFALPARRRRADRGLRGQRGLRRRGPGRVAVGADRASGARAGGRGALAAGLGARRPRSTRRAAGRVPVLRAAARRRS